MEWLIALIASVFGVTLDKVVDLANREDTVEDSNGQLLSELDTIDSEDLVDRYSDLDEFGMSSAYPDSLC